MKTNLQVSGNVELDEKEIQQALLKYALEEKKLVDIVNNYLSPQNLTTKKLVHTQTPNGIRVVAEVTSASKDTLSYTPPVQKETKERNMPSFTKKNKGYADKFTEFLDEQRKKKRKEIPFNEYMEEMQFLFPTMDYRRLYIYLSDKKLQASRRFKFDTDKKVIKL
jgi:hypothetical protein